MLLEIASTGAYRPLWSSEILAELDRTLRLLLAKRGTPAEETDAYLTRLFRQMRITFPAAHWTWTAATYSISSIFALVTLNRGNAVTDMRVAHLFRSPAGYLPLPGPAETSKGRSSLGNIG